MDKNYGITASILDEYGLPKNVRASLLSDTNYNSVFYVKTENKIIRVGKKKEEIDLLFELSLIRYLHNEGFPVANWFTTKDGNPFFKISNKVNVILFEYIKGATTKPSPISKPGKLVVFRAGEALGNLHRLTGKYNKGGKVTRNIYTEFNRVLNDQNKFSSHFDETTEFINSIEQMIQFGLSEDTPIGAINNDYRPGNVIFNNKDEITGVVDFDWACMGPLVKDLALGLVEWTFPDGAKEPWEDLMNTFLEGYNKTSKNKWKLNRTLLQWVMFACLSDACTYFADLMDNPNNTKRSLTSYMYKKYDYFKNLNI